MSLCIFGIVLAGGVKNRVGQRRNGETGKRRWGERRRIGLLIAMIMIAGMLLVSCGDDIIIGDDEDGDTEISDTVAGLNPNTTYYWKVIADDGHGGTTESKIKSFTTKQ